MKLIGKSPISEKNRLPKPLADFMQKLRHGSISLENMQSQENVIALLGRELNNNFIMLQNISLEGLRTVIPLVLIGPPGIMVIYPSGSRGVYRAREDLLEKLDERSDNFKPTSPNLVSHARLMARAVEIFLKKNNQEQEVKPVLIFTDPGVHLEMKHPNIRIVLMDAIKPFASRMLQSSAVLDQRKIQIMVNLLKEPETEDTETEDGYSEIDAFSFADEEDFRRQILSGPTQPRLDEKMAKAINKIPFTTRQWAVIGILAFVNIFILIAVIAYFLIF